MFQIFRLSGSRRDLIRPISATAVGRFLAVRTALPAGAGRTPTVGVPLFTGESHAIRVSPTRGGIHRTRGLLLSIAGLVVALAAALPAVVPGAAATPGAAAVPGANPPGHEVVRIAGGKQQGGFGLRGSGAQSQH